MTGILLFISMVACVCHKPCIVVAGSSTTSTKRLNITFNPVDTKGSCGDKKINESSFAISLCLRPCESRNVWLTSFFMQKIHIKSYHAQNVVANFLLGSSINRFTFLDTLIGVSINFVVVSIANSYYFCNFNYIIGYSINNTNTDLS